MNFSYAVALILSAIISLVIAIYARRHHSIKGAKGLALAMTGLTIWSFTYAIRWLSAEPAAQIFWLNATYLGVIIAPTSFFILSMEFTDHPQVLSPRNIFLLTIEPVLTLLIIFTDSYHGLFFAGLQTTDTILDGGVWFWFNLVYSYTLILISAILLAINIVRGTRFYRSQSIIFLVGLLIPWLGNIVSFLNFSPFPGLDLTPLLFMGSGLLFFQALFRKRFLNITSIAREALVEGMTDGVFVLDSTGNIVDYNLAANAILGLHREHIGQQISACIPLWDDIFAPLVDSMEQSREVSLPGHPGKTFEIHLIPLVEDEHKVTGDLVLVRDISERKAAEIALVDSEKRYRLLFENSADLIIVIQDGKIAFCNPQTMKSTGYTLKELKQVPFIEFVFPEDKELVIDQYTRRINEMPNKKLYQFRFVTKQGDVRWAESRGMKIQWDGRSSTLNFLSDITERKTAEDVLKFQSTHDALTGLYNRSFYQDALENLKHNQTFPFSIIMIDMNGLKQVNDSLGHSAGDDILCLVAKVLQQTFHPEDVVARLGGDEFVIVLPEANRTAAQIATDRLRSNIALHNQGCLPYQRISLSIGVATSEDDESPESVVNRADHYMYEEKQQGGESML